MPTDTSYHHQEMESPLLLKLPEAIFRLLSQSVGGMTPQQLRDQIKVAYPYLYDTPAQRKSVEAGHFNDIGHALLAAIYTAVKKDERYLIDRSVKPFRVSLEVGTDLDGSIEAEAGENPELQTGIVYVLGTGVYTKDGKHIVKIGYTTQDLAARIRQLYTTGAMFKFEELASYRVDNYDLLESALHKLLAPFRLNNAREFFSEEVIPYVAEIAAIHQRIQAAPGAWARQ